MHWFRIVIGGSLALALPSISILCCYTFGTHLASGSEGQLYGVLGGVADALKAVLPIGITAAFAARQRARAFTGMLLFATFSAYSFASELGLYALSRDAQASTVSGGKAGFDLLKQERERIRERLAALGQTRPTGTIKADIAAQHQNRLWPQTAECKDASTAASRTFCAGIETLAGELASAEEAERLRADDAKLATKMAGMDLAAVMKSADPQSEALARFTGLSPATMRDALAVLVAVLIELGSGFGLWVVTVGSEAKMAAAPLLNAQSPSMAGASSPQAKMAAAPLPVKKPAQKPVDPVKAFAKAMLAERATGEVTAAELHGAYVEWARREGIEEMSATALGRRLSALQFARVKRGGRVLYTGVALAAGSRVN
jgi:hypothetical protein